MILSKKAYLFNQLTNISTLPEISNFFTFIPCVFRICRHILCSRCVYACPFAEGQTGAGSFCIFISSACSALALTSSGER